MTDLSPDFRALCAELLSALETEVYAHWSIDPEDHPLCERARAALATPPPEPPTVMEILDLSGEIEDAGLGQIDLVRAALERWGHR
jgi:hypothetical protein